MSTETNKVTDVVVGTYGVPIILQMVDSTGLAVDISSYITSITITAKAPNAVASKTFTGSFVTNGTDGKIQFTPTVNNNFTVPGTWEGQVELTKSGADSKTVVFDIEVEKSI